MIAGHRVQSVCRLLFVGLMGAASAASAQLYSEQFEGAALSGKGAAGDSLAGTSTDMAGVTNFTIDISHATLDGDTTLNWFRVEDGRFEAQDVEGYGIWESIGVDVGEVQTALIRLDFTVLGAGDNSAVDTGFAWGYRLDGGAPTIVQSIDETNQATYNGSTLATTVDTSAASNLRVHVQMGANGSGDGFQIDSVAVEETSSTYDQPPHLAPIGLQTVTVSNELVFHISATENDSDPVTLSLSNAPPGSVFSPTNGVGGAAGSFVWTPTNPGGISVEFFAADADGVDTQSTLISVREAGTGLAWINELHYDNVGVDRNEGVEIAGPAGLDLSGYTVYAYNGFNQSVYASLELSGVIDGEGCGLGALWFDLAGVQNGSPDGLALVDPDTNVLQFISYEGTMTAADGPASGLTSVELPVAEPGASNQTLQLTGYGDSYGEFAWAGPTNGTRGALNGGQAVVPCSTRTDAPPMFFDAENQSVARSNRLTFTVRAIDVADEDPISLTASNLPAGARFGATNGVGTFTWTNAAPAGTYTTRYYAADKDGVATSEVIVTVFTAVQQLTIMAANLAEQFSACDSEYGAAAARIFRGLAPDIVAVQEWVVSHPDGLRGFVDENFGVEYDYFIEQESFFSGSTDCSIPNGIISRWPILEAGEWDNGVGGRDFVWAKIDISASRALYVISAHFKAGGDASDISTREQQARSLTNLVARNIAPTNFIAVCGDFNLQSRSENTLSILTQAFSDRYQPVDQAGDPDTNEPRTKPYDLILPNATLDARHATIRIGGEEFPDGMVFDSWLWASPPAPILPGDSHVEGVQHMAVMKSFIFQEGIPPVLQTIGDQAVEEGVPLSFAVSATETDADLATLSASNLPPGAVFGSTNVTGLFSWSSPGPAGTYTSKFYAVDNDGADVETVTFEVLTDSDVDGDGLPDAWETSTFGGLGVADATSDVDGDGMIDRHEYVAGTDAAAPGSVLEARIAEASGEPDGVVVIHWPSRSNRVYGVWRGTNLLSGFTALDTNIPAVPPENVYTDAAPPAAETLLYRIRVQDFE